MKKLLKKLLVMAILTFTNVNAQYVDLSTQLTSYQTPTISVDGNVKNVYAGELLSTLLRGTLPSGLNSPFPTFCTDLELTLNSGQGYSYSVITDPNNVNTSLSNPSWANVPSVTLGNVAWIYNQYQADPNKSSAAAAGAQMAIWETLYDGNNVDAGNGRFKIVNATPESLLKLIQYTSGMDSSTLNYIYFQRSGEVCGQPQSLITTVVPEPTTYALIAVMGCLGMAVFHKNTKKV